VPRKGIPWVLTNPRLTCHIWASLTDMVMHATPYWKSNTPHHTDGHHENPSSLVKNPKVILMTSPSIDHHRFAIPHSCSTYLYRTCLLSVSGPEHAVFSQTWLSPQCLLIMSAGLKAPRTWMNTIIFAAIALWTRWNESIVCLLCSFACERTESSLQQTHYLQT